MAIAIAFGLWLRWPTLYGGFYSDDFVEPAMRDGAYPSPRAMLDLFNFADGSATDNARLTSYGSLPWWTAPGLRLAMMRPLSSALVLLDRALFDHDVLAYHVHSMLWWVALMLVAAALLAELFPSRVASLAILLFALEEGHTVPLIWLANRGAMVAMVFGLWGLWLHVRARREQRPVRFTRLFGSFVCFSIALLTGEWAFPLLGYVLAYELFGQQGPLSERLRALWPVALPGTVFLLARAAFGYGALHSGVYIDPITEASTFALASCQRIPVFFADLFFSVPAMWWGIGTPWRDFVLSLQLIPARIWVQLPGWHFWHVSLGLVAMLATALILRAGLRDRPEPERRQIRWLLIGAFISLLPMVASFPTSRLVLPAAVAASAAAAIVILRSLATFRAHWPAQRARAAMGVSTALLVGYFQIWQAARTSYGEARSMTYNFASIRGWVLDAQVDDRKVESQSLVMINSLEHSSTMFAPWIRRFYGRHVPRANLVLSGAPNAHDLYRPSPKVLELSVLGGTMMNSDLEALYRDERFAFRVGDSFRTSAFRAEVTRVIWGKPQSVRFSFDEDLDDPSYVFLYSNAEGLVRARLPEVGQRLRFRKGAFPDSGLARLLRNERDPNVSCPGTRPPIDECRLGFFFADCMDGSRQPPLAADAAAVFACHGIGDCRWFAQGCVAEGYLTSSCNERDLCCEQGWPFPNDAFASKRPFSQRLAGSLRAWGREPWDAARDMNVEVQIVPTLLPLPPELRCAGPVPLNAGPCNLGQLDLAQPQQSSLRFSFTAARPVDGWLLTTEVVDDRSGQLHARVCRVSSAASPAYELSPVRCPPPDAAPICAQVGTLLLSRFPLDPTRLGTLSGRLDARFADGLRVQAEF